MVFKKKFVVALAMMMSMITLFFCATNVDAARTDMVDVSNNNGSMTLANFQDMYSNYGVKSMVTKISEGSSYKDADAATAIKNAQAAGLYVNGYHYARYSTVSGAIAEADFAGKTAQADGLPTGAVLATDVESSEQSSLTTAQNDANNKAFMTEIAKYGYRSCIYTMGSWVGSKMTVDDGWIASYPYNPAGQEWYTGYHAWQWSSTYQFSGSYGNFDVSELYDDYFTSYESPTGSTTTTTGDNSSDSSSSDSSATTDSGSNSGTGSITVSNSSGSYVPLVALQNDGSMATVSNRALGNNTSWATDQTKTVDGVTYYRVATNEWVNAKYLSGNSGSSTDSASSDTDVIKVSDSSSAYVTLMALQDDGTMKTVSNRALGNNTSWVTDQTKTVDGVTYYRVATNEWVASTYVIS
ncbi:GH25 family lysozyme [Companilactobacillus halodurans]|uniref:1,4-beta-N-acetylmuramidase n=1 Tax=Companilactobacillus halodurans TaxID=2584183 RepID=A0A5P0ZLP8_9LACO|nr:GH25 family lysozyme [Companilactobacillus halodurans]MQS75170.1 1,4-beta-N-acetylmuramidase [Companilactobacillus halodurans]MQS97565.1 1,4-beta-N-acetylmuramidase [Companilactobacillus halodurans]